MLKSFARRASLTGLLLVLPALAAAQQSDSLPRPTMRAVWREGVIRIDGALNEGDWQRAVAATDFVQSMPNPGANASLRTEARVLYDRDALYVGVRLYDDSEHRADYVISACDGYDILFTMLEGRYCTDKMRDYYRTCLLYTSPSPRDRTRSRMPSSA